MGTFLRKGWKIGGWMKPFGAGTSDEDNAEDIYE